MIAPLSTKTNLPFVIMSAAPMGYGAFSAGGLRIVTGSRWQRFSS